jgi:N-acetylneuraminic acid mutarotase
MPTGRAALAAAIVGNAIYAIGGRSFTGGPCSGFGAAELGTVERYDISTDTWTTVAPLPSPRSDLAAATIGGKIYVFGGCRGSFNILSDVDVYDPATDTWSTLPTDMPTARAGMYAVGTKGGTVYVIGGWDGIGFGLNTNEAYKVSQDQWATGLPPMPTARAETGAASHGGRIYIVGGARPGFGASVDANEVFKP